MAQIRYKKPNVVYLECQLSERVMSTPGTPHGREPPRFPPGKQPKAVLQRSYRKNERDSFDHLRDVIKQLTRSEPLTRQEILAEATRLLRTLPVAHAHQQQQLPENYGNAVDPQLSYFASAQAQGSQGSWTSSYPMSGTSFDIYGSGSATQFEDTPGFYTSMQGSNPQDYAQPGAQDGHRHFNSGANGFFPRYP